jgi:hypothetical protein
VSAGRAAALLLALGCGPGAPRGAAPAGDSAPAADSGGAGRDSAPPDSAAPDSGVADTGAPPPCTTPLEAAVDGVPLAAGAPLDFGAPAAHTAARRLALTLTNRCPGRVRFLGHPADWLTGAGFTLDTLPPVVLEPGGTATLGLRFSPGAAGPAAGQLQLPHDGPEAPFQAALQAVVGPPLVLVLVGDGGHILSSVDYGATVAHESWSTLTPHTAALIRGVCWGGGRFVAVGGNAERRTWWSDDGLTWSDRTESGAPLGDCAHGGGRFVSFDGAPLWSADGLAWSRGAGSTPAHLRAIAAGDGLFVAVGDGGLVATTTDGAAWDTLDTVGTADWGRVAVGGGVWVAAGAGGAVARSDDGGVTWLAQTVGTGGRRWQGLVYADGWFYLGDGAEVHRSADGAAWARVNAADAVPLAAVGSTLLGLAGPTLTRSDDGGFSWAAQAVSAGGLGFGDAVLAGELP